MAAVFRVCMPWIQLVARIASMASASSLALATGRAPMPTGVGSHTIMSVVVAAKTDARPRVLPPARRLEKLCTRGPWSHIVARAVHAAQNPPWGGLHVGPPTREGTKRGRTRGGEWRAWGLRPGSGQSVTLKSKGGALRKTTEAVVTLGTGILQLAQFHLSEGAEAMAVTRTRIDIKTGAVLRTTARILEDGREALVPYKTTRMQLE